MEEIEAILAKIQEQRLEVRKQEAERRKRERSENAPGLNQKAPGASENGPPSTGQNPEPSEKAPEGPGASEKSPDVIEPDIQQKLPDILRDMWRFSFSRQDYSFVSKAIKNKYGSNLLRLTQRVYDVYVESNGNPSVLQKLIQEIRESCRWIQNRRPELWPE